MLYLHPNPPILAGMGWVQVHLKLNGWVPMGAHIYILYNGLKGPWPPHNLNEVRTRIKNSGPAG